MKTCGHPRPHKREGPIFDGRGREATVFKSYPCPNTIMVDVRTRCEHFQIIGADDGLGVFVEEAGVGLEVDDAVGFQETAVALEEKRGGQAGVLAAAELPKKASMNSMRVRRKATLPIFSSVASLAPFHRRAPLMSTPMKFISGCRRARAMV